MLAEPDPQKKSAFKHPFLYSWTVLGVAALVVCLILVSRWKENRDIERRAREAQTRQQREQDRLALEHFGGKELAIQNFYAVPGVARRGESVQLCYGVANAKTDRKSTRLNSSHTVISYAVFCLKKKKTRAPTRCSTWR